MKTDRLARCGLAVTSIISLLVAVLACDIRRPTPTPVPTPLPPQPPHVLRRSPERGQELDIQAPVVITFDQAMDRASVESAFSITPAVVGTFEWQDDTLSFFPTDKAFSRATTYHIVVASAARSAAGQPLPEPLSFSFYTVGYLEVTAVQPEHGTLDVALDARITVMFSRPVVPLSAISIQTGLPQPLTFVPPITGEGEWLNTSIYTFHPVDGFVPGTTYKARIAAGLQDTAGGVLATDHSWEFTTQRPRVVQVAPEDNATNVGPTPIISVTFNMPMDQASAEHSFSLMPGGAVEPLPGSFHWQGKTMSFTPSVPLDLDTAHTIAVAAGARTAVGNVGVAHDITSSFTTIQLPRILLTNPIDGEDEAHPYTSLNVTFSSPMNRDSLLASLTILPEPTDVYTSWAESDTQLYVSFGAQASTAYTFTFGADIEGRYGHKLGAPHVIHFVTRPLSPSIYLASDRIGTFDAYTTTAAYVRHTNVSSLNLNLYHLDTESFLLLTGRDGYSLWEKFEPGPENLIRKWRVSVESDLNAPLGTSAPLARDGVSPLPPGFYCLEASAPEVDYIERQVLIVSHSAVTLKVTQDEALVWVTDLQTGHPAPGLPVTVFGPSGHPVVSGSTDRNGLFFADGILIDDYDPWAPIVAIAGPEDAPAVASTHWSSGISHYEFGIPGEPNATPYQAYLYTDRTIYRPGQPVYFRGILRHDDDSRYTLPQGIESLRITMQDGQGNDIYHTDLPLSDLGTFHGELKLADDAGLGYYYLSTNVDERTYGTGFRVAEYRKPEFEVTISTDKQEYVQGEEIITSASAEYYFGGPVADAAVTWRLMSQDYRFQWTGEDYYDFHDDDYASRGERTYYGELVGEGEGTTDAQGRFTFTVPADIAARRNSQLFTLEASVTDVSHQEVSGRSSVLVHKGLFYIGLAPQQYVGSTDRESKVDVITVDSKSVQVPYIPLQLVFLRQTWYNVQQQASDGRFYWEWQLQETPVHTTTVTTDATGKAVAQFTPDKGGAYRVRAFGRDRMENEIRSSAYLWISSRDYVAWRQENHDRIELVTDKKSYRPGETARILIPSPFQGEVKALLTVERGHIYSYRMFTLSSNSDQIEIPILSDYTPNAYVSVVLVKGTDGTNPVASHRVGYVALDISSEEKELTVRITPNETTSYRPAAKAMFDVQATDYLGRGVEAELSLQLVDLSVLALTGGDGTTMLEHFYRKRGLGVRTGASLAISVDRYRYQTQAPSAKGGDGALVSGDLIRSRFPDTAYWNAEVRTDAQGRATVTVDLPDNLTTWRMAGKGITADTLVGEGQVDIVTSKDLLLRSVAPRFFVLGDQVQIGAVVHNNTDHALAVDVALEGQGVQIERGARQVEIAAQGKQDVHWQAEVVDAGSAVLTWRASSADLSDALQLTLPVYHYSTPEVVATAGQVPSGETRVETVRLPERLDPSHGELTIQLEPSLAAGMRDGLQYLEEYPYDCIEQTVSRFLPNVMTYRALRELDIQNAQLEARLPQFVSTGLQRLYALQHYDGGWGWWLADDSNPFISAYALLGMNAAAEAGFAVDRNVMARAAKYLYGELDSTAEPALQPNTRAFVLYVLAEYGDGDLGRTVALFEKRESLDTYGKAYLVLALHTLQPDVEMGLLTLLSDFNDTAILSAAGAHWEEDTTDYWTMNTNNRTTAMVLSSLLRVDPDNPLIPNVVRWLMSTRKQGHWETTQETAWSLMALTDFLLSTGELQADYDYRVTLNGERLDQRTVTAQDVAEMQKLVVEVKDLLLDENNRLVLERPAPGPDQTGQGQLYYSLYLRYYLPVQDVVALNRGIFVSRQYSLADDPDRVVDTVQVGDVIQVKLTVIAPNDLHYLVVEDPLPSGCEALDTSLKTTSAAYQAPDLTRQDSRPPYWWYFVQSELHDEKVALFATYLSKGTYEYTYLIRASLAGRFLTMPAQAYEMYFPEVFGRSDGGLFTIN